MSRRALYYFIAGQICFLAGTLLCIAIRPMGLSTNNGISYYGRFMSTYFAYVLALLGPAVFGILSAKQISEARFRPIRQSFLFFSAMLAVLAFSTYSGEGFINWSHRIAGTLLFSLQILLGFWLVTQLRQKFWPIVFLIIEIAAGIMTAIYLMPERGFLIQFQMLFQLAFGALMIYAMIKLTSDKKYRAPTISNVRL